MEDKLISDLFCHRCKFLLDNIQTIHETHEQDETKKTDLFGIDNIPVNEPNFFCNFCFGIMSVDHTDVMIEQIKSKINNFEYYNFKLTTNFSPLFLVIHHYWKIMLKNKFDKNKNIQLIDISLFRKAFKPYMIPKISTFLDKFHTNKSDFEVRCLFDFDESFYSVMYDTLEISPVIKKIGKSNFKPNSIMIDRGILNDALKSLSVDLFLSLVEKYRIFNNPENKTIFKIEMLGENLFFKGCYNKFSRELGQSPWYIDGQRLCDTSVEEEITRGIMKVIECDSCVLHAGGREDRDVRMLGNGRPFIVEIFNPKNRITPLNKLKELEATINSNSKLVSVRDFDVCERSYFDEVKKYEDSKKKLYCCVVWASKTITDEDIEKINNIKDLDIIQKTPLRVLHRRTLMDRKKKIFSLKAKKFNENFMIVDVESSAGTYIKEFIHSDLNRTIPNLGTILGYECDIIQLDVLNMIFDKA